MQASMVEIVRNSFDTGMEYRCSKGDIDHATMMDEERRRCSKRVRMIQTEQTRSQGGQYGREVRTWQEDGKLHWFVRIHWRMAGIAVVGPQVAERRYTNRSHSVLAAGSTLIHRTWLADLGTELHGHCSGSSD